MVKEVAPQQSLPMLVDLGAGIRWHNFLAACPLFLSQQLQAAAGVSSLGRLVLWR